MGLVCCVGDLTLGIQCESPVAFIGAGLLTVPVDVNLMFVLAYAFRHIGKAIAVILLIVQIPGSSGMFPIEMMPDFFQVIHPLLPFTYSIDAMREAIGNFWDGLPARHVAAGTFVRAPGGSPSLGWASGALRFQFEPHVRRELGATDLLLAEPVTASAKTRQTPARYRTRTLVRAALNIDAFRQALSSPEPSVSTAPTRCCGASAGWQLVRATMSPSPLWCWCMPTMNSPRGHDRSMAMVGGDDRTCGESRHAGLAHQLAHGEHGTGLQRRQR